MKALQKLEPSWLPPGAVVGPWKVKGYLGGGAYGAVFRAVRAGREHGGLFALKVAWVPGDPRFQREAELLSRIQHPSVPRLRESGAWQQPGGATYPYLVMDWLEGVPLYEWAVKLNPSSQEASRVLAQIARALEATHGVEGVHRDVKGANILVNPVGLRAFLTDFGAGNYAGALPLTREGLPPGTDNYRSPEAWDFALHCPRNAPSAYEARPADDVLALGVSAYRLVTGAYPPAVEVREEESGPGRVEWPEPPAPGELNPRVAPELSALILRMLSVRPEERPTAGELAEALERLARSAAPGADWPLFERKEQERAAERVSAEQRQAQGLEEAQAPAVWALARARVPAWTVGCAAFVGVIAALTVGWGLRHAWEGTAQHGGGEGQSGPGPVGVGDTSLPAPTAQEDAPSGRAGVGLPMPEEPLKGQRRAPHCRPPVEVSIHGGCWIPVRDVKPPCGELSYEWQGGCYAPNYSPPRQPTSEPQ